MNTTIHHYWYNLDDSDKAKAEQDRKAYAELCERMKANGIECFESWGGEPHYNGGDDGLTLTLDTTHVYDNQWSATTPDGRRVRVFDWAQDYHAGNFTNKNIKKGHWLEITDEMKQARERMKCGYCGHQDDSANPPKFCPKCIGSEYLEEKALPLTRMRKVTREVQNKPVPPLTEKEKADLLPKWRKAQGLGKQARDAAIQSKRRQTIANLVTEAKDKAVKLIREAEIKTKALTFLMDSGYRDIENVIYYSHTDKFSFGWRHKITPEDKSLLLDILSEFPFEYEFDKRHEIAEIAR